MELGKTNILHVTSGWATGHVTQAKAGYYTSIHSQMKNIHTAAV